MEFFTSWSGYFRAIYRCRVVEAKVAFIIIIGQQQQQQQQVEEEVEVADDLMSKRGISNTRWKADNEQVCQHQQQVSLQQ